MSRLPCTRAESVRIGRDGPADRDRSRAVALLRRLRDSEAALARDDGRAPEVAGLLRELVLAVRELAGTRWITARAASPAIAAFMALDRMPRPPALADLDRVLAVVLQARFPVRNGPLPLADVRRRPRRPAARHGFAVMSRSASATSGTAGPQDGQWPSRAAMPTPTGLAPGAWSAGWVAKPDVGLFFQQGNGEELPFDGPEAAQGTLVGLLGQLGHVRWGGRGRGPAGRWRTVPRRTGPGRMTGGSRHLAAHPGRYG
jgi:hypothetical protein